MGTLPAWWTDPYPEVSSTKTATDYLDGLGAALTRHQEDGSWVLSTGEQELITADTAEELDSFVLGFALAHLICERHGPIGERSGPTRLPHPTEMEGQAGGGGAADEAGAVADTGDGDGDEGGDQAGDTSSGEEATAGDATAGDDDANEGAGEGAGDQDG